MKSFSKILKHPAVDFISDERASGDGIWVELKKGYIDSSSDVHAIHEDTVKEIMDRLPAVTECKCKECVSD